MTKQSWEPNRKRIDVHEAYELTYCSAKFGVSREKLEEAEKKGRADS